MQPWFAFYTVTGGASAALLGLLFVAVSMNAAVMLGDGHEGSRRLAEQAFGNYLVVLMVSVLALFPQITLTEFSSTALSLTVVSAGWMLVRLYLTLTRPADLKTRLFALRRHLAALVGFGMLFASALAMILRHEDHRSWFAAALMVLLFSATEVSWELLMRVAKLKPAA